MLVRVTLFAGIAAVAALQIPGLLGADAVSTGTLSAKAVVQPKPIAEASQAPVASVNSVRLSADAQGHFNGDFKLNGRSVAGMIDTGATYVALNESTARRLGFTAAGLDFRHAVNTANGQAKAARVKLDRVEIGSLRVSDVEAMVLRDEALSTTLIGMSFLNKLSSYAVAGKSLNLVK